MPHTSQQHAPPAWAQGGNTAQAPPLFAATASPAGPGAFNAKPPMYDFSNAGRFDDKTVPTAEGPYSIGSGPRGGGLVSPRVALLPPRRESR